MRLKSETPAFARLIAPPDWTAIDLLSDLHLSPALPRTVERLRRHLAETPASAVLLLGEPFTAGIAAGTVLVIAGIWMLAKWR